MAKKEDTTRAKLGIKARQDAVKFILDKYHDEFVSKHEANRVAAGLPRTTQGDSPEDLRAKLRKAEERAEQYRRRLEMAEADQNLARSR